MDDTMDTVEDVELKEVEPVRHHHSRGRPKNNRSAHAPLNRKPDRDIERTTFHDSDEGTGYSGFNIPDKVISSFRKTGYELGFFGIKDQSIQRARNLGWMPVKLSEIPEWSAHFIPIGEAHEEALKEYCVYVDVLLMKIPTPKLNVYHDRLDRMRKRDTQYVNDARRNGHYVDRGRVRDVTPMTAGSYSSEHPGDF